MESITPTEADFDDMHHALGRPDGPHVAPYRNRYCCAADGPEAKRFMVLGLWERGRLINGGKDAFFSVTPEGVRQVMAWLVARQRAEGLRPWLVKSPYVDTRTVIAKSRSAARFSVYRDISDCYHFDNGFRGFLALGVSVTAARAAPEPPAPIPF